MQAPGALGPGRHAGRLPPRAAGRGRRPAGSGGYLTPHRHAPATCAKLLRGLCKSGFLFCNDPVHTGYALTPCGRAKVADLLNFLPRNHA